MANDEHEYDVDGYLGELDFPPAGGVERTLLSAAGAGGGEASHIDTSVAAAGVEFALDKQKYCQVTKHVLSAFSFFKYQRG